MVLDRADLVVDGGSRVGVLGAPRGGEVDAAAGAGGAGVADRGGGGRGVRAVIVAGEVRLRQGNRVLMGVGMRIGIRELRNRLKHYVDTARQGEDVIITERGRPVARLVALHEERPIDRLIKAGIVTPPRKAKSSDGLDWTPVASSGSVSDLIER